METKKPFLSDKTKDELVENDSLYKSYTLDCFDYLFNNMPKCEKKSIQSQINRLWAIVIIVLTALVGVSVKSALSSDTVNEKVKKIMLPSTFVAKGETK